MGATDVKVDSDPSESTGRGGSALLGRAASSPWTVAAVPLSTNCEVAQQHKGENGEWRSVVIRIEIGRELAYNDSAELGWGSPVCPAPLPGRVPGGFSEVRLTRPLGHCDRSCCHTLRRPHPRFPSLPSPGVVENPTVGKCQDGGVLARWAGRPRVYPSARKVADPPRWGIGPCSPSVRLWSALSHCPGTQSPGSAGS